MSSPIVPLQSRSDAEGGFSVQQGQTGVVRVRAWGFWSVEIASAFAKSVMDVCRAASVPRSVTLDAEELKPLRDEGQSALLAMFDAAAAMGVAHVSVVTSSPLTRLMLARIVKGTAKKGFVELKTGSG